MPITCDVSVVLLCKGRGADAASYRPNRDGSQWWSRRDALVRCVASFLHGPGVQKEKKEMILLFDDDNARMHISLDKTDKSPMSSSAAIPTEQKILTLWKKAAQTLNHTVSQDGLLCRIHVDPILPTGGRTTNTTSKTSSPAALPTGLDSKRQVLEYMQKHCSLEFLRSHGLNSNASVILRKTNKKALMGVWGTWRKQQVPQNREGPRKASESLFSSILQSSVSSSDNVKTVAGTLHESCDEFPCFGLSNPTSSTDHYHVFFFLGAVRDMTEEENNVLAQVCEQLSVPTMNFRFGTVPEFTSKILTVLAYHQSQGVLGPSLQRMLSQTGKETPPSMPLQKTPTSLHVVCAVSAASSEISLELEHRDRLHWSLVRMCVCALWRSRLVSSSTSSSASHSNSLHLVFQDGLTVHLTENDFVAKLASQHQAAPCEHQILSALLDCIKLESIPDNACNSKKHAKKLLSEIVSSSTQAVTATISITPDGSKDLCEEFYSSLGEGPSDGAVVAILDLQREVPEHHSRGKVHRALLRASEKLGVPVTQQSILASTGQDFEAAAITMVQHFCYQNRVFATKASKKTKLSSKRKRSAGEED